MIINTMTSSAGPSMISLFYAASLWLVAMMIVLYHRAGIQLMGTLLAIVGLAFMLFHSFFFLSLTLFALGIFLHSCGRLLFNLKRRS